MRDKRTFLESFDAFLHHSDLLRDGVNDLVYLDIHFRTPVVACSLKYSTCKSRPTQTALRVTEAHSVQIPTPKVWTVLLFFLLYIKQYLDTWRRRVCYVYLRVDTHYNHAWCR